MLTSSVTVQSNIQPGPDFPGQVTEAIPGHGLFAEFDPFAPRRGVIIPIELGVIGKNLQAAAHEQEYAKQIDEMVDPQPEWKS